jgi:branched-chain amino acid transport system substrate-binding protein
MSSSRQIDRAQRPVWWIGRLSVLVAVVMVLSSLLGSHLTSAKQLHGPAGAGNVIKIGVLTTLAGPFAVPGQDGFRGVQLAFKQVGYKVAGKTIKLIEEGTDASVGLARDKVRKLVEQEGVDFVIGPLSGDEGLYAVKPYAKLHPNITFINGTSAAEDTTLRSPAKNFFRFTTDGVQWMAGVGTYAYNVKHYHRMALVAEDYSFPYSQVAGFMTEFCRLGGHMVQKNWVPIGTHDYSSVVTKIPSNIDAVYVALGGSDAVNFLKAYDQFGGKAPIVGGSITVDQTVLGTKGALQKRLIGVPSAGPTADNNPAPAWQQFVRQYRTMPGHLPFPGLFSQGYYYEARAAILGLQKVQGDLSGGQKKFQNALAHLRFSGPTGVVYLDHNRQAVADNFLTEVVQQGNSLFNKLISVKHAVNQTLGVPEAQFLKRGPLSRNNPSCP